MDQYVERAGLADMRAELTGMERDELVGGGVRPIRTRLYMGRMAAPCSA